MQPYEMPFDLTKLCGIDCCLYTEKDTLFEDSMRACAARGIKLQRCPGCRAA